MNFSLFEWLLYLSFGGFVMAFILTVGDWLFNGRPKK